MIHRDKIIGASDQPEYAAARWLLDNNAASPDDRLETYRGEMMCMSGEIGKLAKWTVEETKHGDPTLVLRRWRDFERLGEATGTPKSPSRPQGWLEPPEAA